VEASVADKAASLMDTAATVNFSHFDDYPERSSSISKVATHPAYPEEIRNLPNLLHGAESFLRS